MNREGYKRNMLGPRSLPHALVTALNRHAKPAADAAPVRMTCGAPRSASSFRHGHRVFTSLLRSGRSPDGQSVQLFALCWENDPIVGAATVFFFYRLAVLQTFLLWQAWFFGRSDEGVRV